MYGKMVTLKLLWRFFTMKKTFAVVLALIMALSMIPAMALASSAETIEVETGVYGNGAETWCGGDASLQPYGAATQFLLRVGGENYATFLAGFDSYSWKFTFTDMEGNKFETTNAPNSKYDGGTWGILRVIANTDKAYIQIGNSYTGEFTATSGDTTYHGKVSGMSWKAADNAVDTCTHGANGEPIVHGIVVGDKELGTEGEAVFTPSTDPYKEPPVVRLYHYHDGDASDFEAYDNGRSSAHREINAAQVISALTLPRA